MAGREQAFYVHKKSSIIISILWMQKNKKMDFYIIKCERHSIVLGTIATCTKLETDNKSLKNRHMRRVEEIFNKMITMQKMMSSIVGKCQRLNPRKSWDDCSIIWRWHIANSHNFYGKVATSDGVQLQNERVASNQHFIGTHLSLGYDEAEAAISCYICFIDVGCGQHSWLNEHELVDWVLILQIL